MPVVILFGAPGAGKGTQAALLAAALGVPAVSTGSILRAEVEAATALGREVQSVMESGALVSDELVSSIVANRLGAHDCRDGMILDGYPRSVPQAMWLEETLHRQARQVDHVVELLAPRGEVVRRLNGRAGVGGRSDDAPAVIDRRIADFESTAEPIRRFYRERGLLVRVDGSGEPHEVTSRLRILLGLGQEPLPAAI